MRHVEAGADLHLPLCTTREGWLKFKARARRAVNRNSIMGQGRVLRSWY